MYGYGMERDEISLFVHQLLLRSSSSSAAVGPPEENAVTGPHPSSTHSSCLREGDEVNVVDDEVQHLPAPPPPPPPPPRASSKRSRAAEIHNQSEKRRRSRINEKLKALQNLIPNSNKTDKASMLDEAIEYLKQLQLQVQMLSMRNRISLQSMCLPGAIQPAIFSHAREGSGEDERLLDFRLSGGVSVGPDSAAHTTSVLPKQYSVSTQLSLPDVSNMLDSEHFCGLETSLRAYLGAALLHKSSDVTSVVAPTSPCANGDPKELATLPPCSASEVREKEVLHLEDLYGNNLETNASELGIEAVVAGSLPSKSGASFLKGNGSHEMFTIAKDSTDLHPKNRKGDLFHISDLILQTISASNSADKVERPTI